MAAAAAPYAAWMTGYCEPSRAGRHPGQGGRPAYEAAFAMTVPPPVIAANRSLLAGLVATNFLGQNTPAIAATETQYGEMWAQDAAAMYGYAGSSASAVDADAVHPCATNHRPRGASCAGRRRRPGQRHVGRPRAVDNVGGTHNAARARIARGGRPAVDWRGYRELHWVRQSHAFEHKQLG